MRWNGNEKHACYACCTLFLTKVPAVSAFRPQGLSLHRVFFSSELSGDLYSLLDSLRGWRNLTRQTRELSKKAFQWWKAKWCRYIRFHVDVSELRDLAVLRSTNGFNLVWWFQQTRVCLPQGIARSSVMSVQRCYEERWKIHLTT